MTCSATKVNMLRFSGYSPDTPTFLRISDHVMASIPCQHPLPRSSPASAPHVQRICTTNRPLSVVHLLGGGGQ